MVDSKTENYDDQTCSFQRFGCPKVYANANLNLCLFGWVTHLEKSGQKGNAK